MRLEAVVAHINVAPAAPQLGCHMIATDGRTWRARLVPSHNCASRDVVSVASDETCAYDYTDAITNRERGTAATASP